MTKKGMVYFVVFLLLLGNLLLPAADLQENRLEGLFRLAVMDYQSGKFREVVKNLELLLSYFEEDSSQTLLSGKIYLVLGAAHEQLGQIQQARKNYQLAGEILEPHQTRIEGIDFSHLQEYQRIIMGDKAPVPVKRGMIEKPVLKLKKKRLSPLLIVAGTAVLGGVTAVLLLKKKRPGDEEIVVDVNYDTRGLGIEWIQVPAGEFMMGDNFNEGDEDEQPVHAVYLNVYYISRYEVTFAQFDKFCEESGRSRPGDVGWGRGNRPVINVTWEDAKAFCQWLSTKTTKAIRLPTEAQWEKAARGTDQRRYPWGNSPPDCSKVNYDCDRQTHPVGSHPDGVSPYGVHDMAGNVSEWCLDGYNGVYYSNCPYIDPANIRDIPAGYMGYVDYVIRGGSWDSSEEIGIRSADRGKGEFFYYPESGYYRPGTQSTSLGFRLVLER